MSTSILIVGIGRNIENSIPFLKTTFEGISSAVDSSAFVVYENNSTDRSPELLREWSLQDSRVQAICEMIPLEEQLNQGKARTWDNKPCRLELIVTARNKLLDIIRGSEYEIFDLVLMVDLDIPQPLPLRETLDAICAFPSDAAAVFSFGVNNVGKMYDFHAYRDDVFPFGPEIIGEDFYSIAKQRRFFRYTNRLKQYEFYVVQSAFNGAALYRRSLLQDCSYSAHPTQDLDEYYRFQARKLGKHPSDIHSNKEERDANQGLYLFGEDGFFYRNNSGYDFPVVIGHSTLHATLAKKGKLYLRPSWFHYSSHVGYNFLDEIALQKARQFMAWMKRFIGRK